VACRSDAAILDEVHACGRIFLSIRKSLKLMDGYA
jgi:hypothetical protein